MPPIASLFFEPLDVLVFRDPRPFMAGQHFLARSQFPLPSVFFGALRSALFQAAGVRFNSKDPFRNLTPGDRDLLGDADSHGSLQLAGPLLASCRPAQRIEPLYPWPQDLDVELPQQSESAAKAPTAHFVVPSQRANGLRWNGNSLATLDGSLPKRQGGQKPKKPSKQRYLLTRHGSHAYAQASAAGKATLSLQKNAGEPDMAIPEESVLVKERRTGISMARADNGPDPRSVEDSMLFTVETWRLAQHYGFAVELSLAANSPHLSRLTKLLSAIDGTTVRLGGKGHLARVCVRHNQPLVPVFEDAKQGNTALKSWCLTPSLVDPQHTSLDLTMALGKTLQLGGFNFRGKKRGPRPLVSAMAPGSILFFKAGLDAGEITKKIVDANKKRGVDHGHLRCAGYGVQTLLPYPQKQP